MNLDKFFSLVYWIPLSQVDRHLFLIAHEVTHEPYHVETASKTMDILKEEGQGVQPPCCISRSFQCIEATAARHLLTGSARGRGFATSALPTCEGRHTVNTGAAISRRWPDSPPPAQRHIWTTGYGPHPQTLSRATPSPSSFLSAASGQQELKSLPNLSI